MPIIIHTEAIPIQLGELGCRAILTIQISFSFECFPRKHDRGKGGLADRRGNRN
jgi:hypothetical protein